MIFKKLYKYSVYRGNVSRPVARRKSFYEAEVDNLVRLSFLQEANGTVLYQADRERLKVQELCGLNTQFCYKICEPVFIVAS
jgi:hypothetical protein